MRNDWSFLTNHAHVMVCLSRDKDLTLREIGDLVGITERAVHRIIHDLASEGAIKKTRHGRANHYELNLDFRFRHPLEKQCSVGQMVRMVSRRR